MEEIEVGTAGPGRVWAPQACTLPASERPLRAAEFDALFAEAVTSVERLAPGRVRLDLRAEPGMAGRAAELAATETGCCSFFTFALTATGGALALEIGVPDRHIEVLDVLTARALPAAGGVG